MGLFAILLGEAICSVTATAMRNLCGRVLTHALRDFDDEIDLASRLMQRNWLARNLGAFSTNSLRRVYRLLAEDPSYQTVPLHKRSATFSSLMHQMLYMSPRLIAIKPESFAEEQRLRTDSELRDGLFIGLPVTMAAVTMQFDDRPIWITVGMCVATPLIGIYLLWDGRRLWREANSQVVHGICDANIPIDQLLPRALDDTQFTNQKSLPRFLARIHDLGNSSSEKQPT